MEHFGRWIKEEVRSITELEADTLQPHVTDLLQEGNKLNAACGDGTDDVLAMLFKASMFVSDWGKTLSHVCGHWRSVALATSVLWTDIHYTPHKSMDKLRTYLDRSKAAELGITSTGERDVEVVGADALRLRREQMGRCREVEILQFSTVVVRHA